MISLSVVIPTLRRQEILPHLIKECQKQTEPADEIIIVDQTAEKSEALSERKDIQYIYYSKPSTPHARNLGVRHAHGDVVLFFDDDIKLPDTTLFQRIREFFSKKTSYAGLALKIVDTNNQLNRENQGAHDRVMQVMASGKVLPFADGPEQDVTAPRGGGVAYQKKAIARVGGFDVRYVGNAMREETDFSLRIAHTVGPIRYRPDMSIIHLALPRGGSRLAGRQQWYRDFFANELLFQLTHFPHRYLFHFFLRKMRPLFACMMWYGKGRPSWLVTPWKGFYEGYRRYKQHFTPTTFE